ncbi:MAG: dUTP diphosphatase, partial [Deltaproteobacteria bacterium]|nr:dUTP diphosphatase [Deltaproteobacteria bacterium]
MAQPLVIQLRRIHPDKDSDIPLPRYMTPQSAGMDLCAAIENDIHLNHGDIVLVPTGFAMSIPEGYEGQIRPR